MAQYRFRMFSKDDSGSLTLLDDSVRQMKAPDTSLYYFFGNLQSGIPWNKYVVREVTLDGEITVDTEGKVSGLQLFIRLTKAAL